MSRMQTLMIMMLLPGLFPGAVQSETPAKQAVAVLPGSVAPETNAQTTLSAMMACRREPAALERLDCYDHILAPEQHGFDGALVKASYEGEAWKRAFTQEKQRPDNSSALMMTQSDGERPTVIITTPAIGNVPPRPVLMFSCVDNITRMQVALTTDNGRFQSHWFIRENGYLLEASRGLAGIDEIRQLFDAKTLTIDTGTDGAAGKLTFNIDGLAKTIAPLRDACHWAGE
ncbi:TPA: type VI secretion system-associated protein VasI [Citrobacter sedlakii]